MWHNIRQWWSNAIDEVANITKILGWLGWLIIIISIIEVAIITWVSIELMRNAGWL